MNKIIDRLKSLNMTKWEWTAFILADIIFTSSVVAAVVSLFFR